MPLRKLPVASISIPLRGNKLTRKAINELAKEKGEYVADLTLDAIRSVHGKRLEELLELLGAMSGNQNDQSGSAT